MSETNVKLLPCPFCGGEAVIDYSIGMDPPCHYKTIRVVCSSCGASSVQRITDGYYDEYCDEEDISEIWNNRTIISKKEVQSMSENETNKRLVESNGELGYFHRWENYSDLLDASPLIGGHPAGCVSRVFAIVEFPDGVRRVDPTNINFIDQENSTLCQMNQKKKEQMKKEEEKENELGIQ